MGGEKLVILLMEYQVGVDRCKEISKRPSGRRNICCDIYSRIGVP